MATRLDRLIILLETGSNYSVRSAAAEQLGAMQAQRSDQLFHLMSRVLPLLQNKSWETRSAGALALQRIAENVGIWVPRYSNDQDDDAGDEEEDWWSFGLVDLANVIESGKPLTSSSGDEYNIDMSGMNSHERLVLMQKQIKEKLGFEGFMNMDFLSQQDLEADAQGDANSRKRKGDEQVNELVAKAKKKACDDRNLSAREQAMMKRQMRIAKKDAKSDALDVDANDLSTMVVSYKGKQPDILHEMEKDYEESGEDNAVATRWPFERICTLLKLHLFDSRWETRHGACLGLLALLKKHSRGAGKVSGLSKDACDRRHRKWMEDTVVRLLCLLALDKFSDFLSDHMVCPVRETAAQVVGIVSANASSTLAKETVTLGLAKLIYCTVSWEVNYSGLLGLKYWIAVRADLVADVIVSDAGGHLWQTLSKGLCASNDEIRSMIASSLGAMLEPLSQHLRPSELVNQLVKPLWDCLLELDDLCSATEPALQLLERCFGYPELTEIFCSTGLTSSANLFERFYPFFRHLSRSVRLAVLECVSVLLDTHTTVPAVLLRLLFQNFILDDHPAVFEKTKPLWSKALKTLETADDCAHVLLPVLSSWFLLVIAPVGSRLDPNLFALKARVLSVGEVDTVNARDHAIIKGDSSIFSFDHLFEGRLAAASAFGLALQLVTRRASADELASIKKLILAYMDSGMLMHRVMCSLAIAAWASSSQKGDSCWDEWKLKLEEQIGLESNTALIGSTCFTDFAPMLMRLRQSLEIVYLRLQSKQIAMHAFETAKDFTFQVANTWLQQYFVHYDASVDVDGERIIFEKEWHAALQLANRVAAAVSRAVLAFQELPAKLTPIIKPLTSSIKSEGNLSLGKLSCDTLNTLIMMLLSHGKAAPVSKLVRNVVSLIPALASNYIEQLQGAFPGIAGSSIWIYDHPDEALSLLLSNSDSFPTIQQLLSENDSPGSYGAGDVEDIKAASKKSKGSPSVAQWLHDSGQGLETHFIAMRGSCMFLQALESRDLLVGLWEDLVMPLLHKSASSVDIASGAVLAAKLGEVTDAPKKVTDTLIGALQEPEMVKRHMASVALARLVAHQMKSRSDNRLMLDVLEFLLTALEGTSPLNSRQGAAEFLDLLVRELDFALLPWLVFFIVPVLARMSDSDTAVRFVCSNAFATLVKWMPLESGAPEIKDLPVEWQQRKQKERGFVNQLIGGSDSVELFEIPVKLNVTLRPYQVEGVNWLAFLRRYGLHGILCDDMGLGKTVQTIAIIASDHSLAASKVKSLVVCPPTLTGHWEHEMKTYVDTLRPVVYQGVDRQQLLGDDRYDVIIASYHSVTRDSALFASTTWNYIVLDEGHVIKNPKTKLSAAVKQLPSLKRLVLSGTPIQNNVLEMWSLFDFLMPGFLGTASQFNERYGKPIIASREAKANSKEQEQGALALEALHKQVLPFLLRRMKEDVLDDLPPKIIQDYFCDLSQLQKQLYKEFEPDTAGESKDHVFQSLQYLRKLCGHPALVLTPLHPQFSSISQQLAKQKSSLHDIQHAPKLLALREILTSCGIGANEAGDSAPVAANHRVLVFAQFRATLDAIEQDLFKSLMPSVTYERLDGSVDASKRHELVQEFNRNPSIDVLLLTTSVGGLGLNLTGADTVVFVEHDWNPMKDLQAMDRAHRLGQKRVVNVYRLITRGTLEEKIMSLQKFKLFTANSIINQDNQGLLSMHTDRVLDLFQLDDSKAGAPEPEMKSSVDKKLTTKQILQQLESQGTWEEDYQDLTLDSFMSKL